MSKKTAILLGCILLLGAALRLYGINWDLGFNLHPDERAIILFSLPLHFPSSLQQFFSPSSPLNPHFFAYGSLPIYLLKTVATLIMTITKYQVAYNNLALIGRPLSALADLATLSVVFLLGKKLVSEKVGLLAALCYALSTFSIQVSHFYAVDTLLTFFILLTLYLLIQFYENPSIGKSLFIGLTFGLALATKDSALALLAAIGSALVADFTLIFSQENRLNHMKKQLVHLLGNGMLICLVAVVTFCFFEPYALIDFTSFWMQTLQQSEMTHNAYAFPYTLQYVGKIPYIYEIKNIFLWGLGPTITILSGIGFFLAGHMVYKKSKRQKWAQELILLVFFLAYFLVVGKFAIGFMRYMLPLYPLLAIFAALAINSLMHLLTKIKKPWIAGMILVYVLFLLCYWPFSFLHIYSKANTRVQATDWILANIPPQSTIAVEHWDDSLPLLNQQEYTMLTLPLYDPDTNEKWQQVNKLLQETDYIVIASNRLYVPLQKLADCKKFPFPYCYAQTSLYYKKLFSGTLGFTKVAQFAMYPTLPFTTLQINDQPADESFTVYDHPMVMIFKKTQQTP